MQHVKNMVKNYSTFTTEVVIETDGIEASVIDIMIARFPHVVTNIFKELDNQTLTTCRNVSRICCDYLDREKILSIRMIQSFRKNTGISCPHWNKVLKNTPVELLKELAVSTQPYGSNSVFQWSSLHIVAEQGNLELCKFIFEKTKDTKPRIENKWTALHAAANMGHKEICKFLINNSDEKNPSDDNGKTPLHFAAEKGLTDVCKLIIENVDNKNPAALNGCTPLHLAAKEGNLETVRLIVETGVDKNTHFNGKTPLQSLGNSKSYTFYKLLSNDNTQFCGMIFYDLWMWFWIFLLFLFNLGGIMVVYLMIHDKMYGNCDLDCRRNNVYLCTLVASVIAFPLIFMIRVWHWFH
jgi:hypothetical protein